jgi:hypothetical protein
VSYFGERTYVKCVLNKMQMMIFIAKRDEVNKKFRILHKEDHHNLYRTPIVDRIVKKGCFGITDTERLGSTTAVLVR